MLVGAEVRHVLHVALIGGVDYGADRAFTGWYDGTLDIRAGGRTVYDLFCFFSRFM